MYRILVVEDHRDSRVALQRFLGSLGYEVRTAEDVPAAERTLGWCPQVVLLDLNLPGASGLHLVEALRAMTPPPRLAFISANVPPMIADYRPTPTYFRKPIDLHRLTEWVADPAAARAADPA